MSNPNRKVYGLSLGAILPALGFSLTWFCCLPIAAGALGAGMAAAGGILTPLRPYFTSLISVLLACGCEPLSRAKGGAVAPGAELKDLKNLEELQKLFNQDKGAPRLILLLSPT